MNIVDSFDFNSDRMDFYIEAWFKNGQYHREDGPAIEHSNGKREWYLHGIRHRETGPAVVIPYSDSIGFFNKLCNSIREWFFGYEIKNAVEKWYFHGVLHRDDGPAIIYDGGAKLWYQNGKLHRLDEPAVVFCGGTKEWYLNGLLHREDGPAVEHANGTHEWYINRQRREDDPAVEYVNRTHEWYINGQRHREDGPAIEYNNGDRFWFRYGKPYLAGEIKYIAIAMSPLKLPPYVLLWILEWSHPGIQSLNQPKIMALLEGIRNSRQRLKDDKN